MLVNNNINFIPANELPEAEGDEVSVLCLENGELKQKPASGLGGGGYDMKVRIWAEPGEEGWPDYYGEVLEGDHATVLKKFNTDSPVIMRIIEELTGEGFHEDVGQYKNIQDSPMTLLKTPDFEVLTARGFDNEIFILPDNSVELG